MVLNTPENRKAIIKYLESLQENEFIDDFIVPYFSSHGFYLYRVADYSPGEHGKDLIFYRHVPIFYDNEYLVIQAKSEKLTTRNVRSFNDQIKRAYDISFPPKSGGGELRAHYALLINSKKHANEADFELHSMVSDNRHIKILSQENVCELILKSGIGPEKLLHSLSKSTPETSSEDDQLVLDTVLENTPAEIDHLLDHKLKFLRNSISPKTKETVIDYIFDRWQSDRSWEGTIKPMKWLDTYFNFMTEKHYGNLIEVLEELTSINPSYKALPYAASIVKKITPDILAPIAQQFIEFCTKMVLSSHKEYKNLILTKLKDLNESNLISKRDLKENTSQILKYGFEEFEFDDEYEAIESELKDFAYPSRRDIRRRRKRIMTKEDG